MMMKKEQHLKKRMEDDDRGMNDEWLYEERTVLFNQLNSCLSANTI